MASSVTVALPFPHPWGPSFCGKFLERVGIVVTKKHHKRITLFDQIKRTAPLTDQERALREIITEVQVLKKNSINLIRLCGGINKILPLLDKVFSQPPGLPKEFFSFLNHRDPKKQQSLEKLIMHLIQTLPDYREPFDFIELLTLLPFPPQLFEIMEDVDRIMVRVRKEVDLRRWRNALRLLEADDCPLEEKLRKEVILDYKLSIEGQREISDIYGYSLSHRLSMWGINKKSGKTAKRAAVWRRIIKNVINYLNPFFVVQRIKRRRYVRDNSSVTNDTLQATAQLMSLTYPAFFPKSDTAKIKRLYYSK